jgi:hypothetical protein
MNRRAAQPDYKRPPRDPDSKHHQHEDSQTLPFLKTWSADWPASGFEVSWCNEADFASVLRPKRDSHVLSRKSRKRVRLRNIDRLILVRLSRLFPSVLDAIVIVKPETVLRWHRRGFRAYWRWKSWRRSGRLRLDRGLQALIRRMSRENPT